LAGWRARRHEDAKVIAQAVHDPKELDKSFRAAEPRRPVGSLASAWWRRGDPGHGDG
jgi:hypothetical protein